MFLSTFLQFEAFQFDHNYSLSPIITATGRKMITSHRKMDHLVYKDATDNLKLFKFGSVMLILSVLVFYIYLATRENRNLSNNIFKMFEFCIQKCSLEYPKSKFLLLSLYLFIYLIYLFYNLNIKTDIVVNDSKKPIKEPHDLLLPEYREIRPIWLIYEEKIIKHIRELNGTDDYTKVVGKAYQMNISKSIINIKYKNLIKTVMSGVRGETAFGCGNFWRRIFWRGIFGADFLA